MGFIMDGLDAEAYDRTYTDRQLVSRIGGYFRPHLPKMLFVAGTIVLNSGLDAALPVLISRGINNPTPAINGAAGGDPNEIWRRSITLLIAIMLAGALSWTFNFFRQTYTAHTVGDVVLDLRKDAFDAVLARDMSFYDEFATGKIVSRVTSDTQDFSNVVTLTLNLISQILLVVIVVGVLFYINPRLALIEMAIAPIVVVRCADWGRM